MKVFTNLYPSWQEQVWVGPSRAQKWSQPPFSISHGLAWMVRFLFFKLVSSFGQPSSFSPSWHLGSLLHTSPSRIHSPSLHWYSQLFSRGVTLSSKQFLSSLKSWQSYSPSQTWLLLMQMPDSGHLNSSGSQLIQNLFITSPFLSNIPTSVHMQQFLDCRN